MLPKRPSPEPGQKLKTVPTYTVAEASSILAIAPSTMYSWYAKGLLEASFHEAGAYLLSYQDMEEAFRLYLLRKKSGHTLQFLQKSLGYARREFSCKHPLRQVEAIKTCLGDLVYDDQPEGSAKRLITSIGRKPGQQLVEEVVDLFAERIPDETHMFPWRRIKEDPESRPVSVNPSIMSGRLVVSGTRIPVSALAGRLRAGSSVFEVADDYDLDPETVEKALVHVGIRKQAA